MPYSVVCEDLQSFIEGEDVDNLDDVVAAAYGWLVRLDPQQERNGGSAS